MMTLYFQGVFVATILMFLIFITRWERLRDWYFQQEGSEMFDFRKMAMLSILLGGIGSWLTVGYYIYHRIF